MADFGVTAVGTGLCSCHKLLLLKLWLMLQEVKQHGLQVLRRFVAKRIVSPGVVASVDWQLVLHEML
jgi:hypothetical protein